ncbi:MAG: cyclic nucleotide-binding domain-containing protein [Elusimicrobiota bacterium]
MNKTSPLIAKLRQIDFFKDFPDTELAKIAPLMKERRYSEGDIVFEEHKPSDELCFIEKGRVLIYKTPSRNRIQEISILTDGDFFGELGVLESAARSASAKALEQTLILTLKAPDIFLWVKKYPDTAISMIAKIVQGIASRLRETTNELTFMRDFSLALIETTDTPGLWDLAKHRLREVIDETTAEGAALFAYNPHLEEFTAKGHWGKVPSDLCMGKKSIEDDLPHLKTIDIGDDPVKGCLAVVEPKLSTFMKKTPLLQTISQALGAALARSDDDAKTRS